MSAEQVNQMGSYIAFGVMAFIAFSLLCAILWTFFGHRKRVAMRNGLQASKRGTPAPEFHYGTAPNVSAMGDFLIDQHLGDEAWTDENVHANTHAASESERFMTDSRDRNLYSDINVDGTPIFGGGVDANGHALGMTSWSD